MSYLIYQFVLLLLLFVFKFKEHVHKNSLRVMAHFSCIIAFVMFYQRLIWATFPPVDVTLGLASQCYSTGCHVDTTSRIFIAVIRQTARQGMDVLWHGNNL